MSMNTFYVFLAAESEFDIRFSPSRLDLGAQNFWAKVEYPNPQKH